MGAWVIRVELNRPLKFLFGSGPVPVIVPFHMPQRSMGFGQLLIDGQCPRRRLFRLWEAFTRWQIPEIAEERVAVGHSGVGYGVIWIVSDSLIKIIDALPEALLRLLVPKVAALQVELKGFGVLRVVLCQ